LGVVLLALVVATKPIGFLLALAILAGEAARLVPRLSAGAPSPSRVLTAVVGLLVGLELAVALNELAAGQLWFGYSHEFLATPPFWLSHFGSVAPVYARSLLLVPPLLIAGVWPFWRRRDLGPGLVIAGLTLLMSFYFFVDRGRSWVDTLVLGPRLILPAVAFLLIGYADLLAGLAARRPWLRPVVSAALVVAPAALALAISIRHHRWQEPQGAALATATRLTAEAHSQELGMTIGAEKVGVLFPGHTSWVLGPKAARRPTAPPVVICSARTWSYRSPDVPMRCELPGYADRVTQGDFHFLVRQNH
jgi:hypothetical protein